MKNVAVVGCGYWGKNLVRNLAESGSLHTICDVETERLRYSMSQYPGVQTTPDFSSLLDR